MMTLQDRKVFSGKRASAGLSSNFKSISREKNAAWGNRFVRDHNDLVYEADPNSIGNRLKQSAKPGIDRSQKKEADSTAKKYEYSPIKQRELAKTSQSQRNIRKGLNLDNYAASLQQMERMKKTNQQTAATTSRKTRFLDQRDNAEVEPFNDYEMDNGKSRGGKRNFIQQNIREIVEYQAPSPQKQVNLLGLSQFEYDATIEGRLSKSNHHINFSLNKTNKINNLKNPWYDHSKDIQKPEDVVEREKAYSLQRIHSFKSDSPHKLFHRNKKMLEDNGCGNGGMLDQVYEVDRPNQYDVNHFRISNDIVDYKTMTPRPDLPKKLGTNLNYKVEDFQSMGLGNRKRPVLQMSHSARKLVFSRQVISPTRGCFR